VNGEYVIERERERERERESRNVSELTNNGGENNGII
jgi:hypothetical protein